MFFIYLLRWQASTLVLAPVLSMTKGCNSWLSAAVANLIGGCIFFWVDKYIFKKRE